MAYEIRLHPLNEHSLDLLQLFAQHSEGSFFTAAYSHEEIKNELPPDPIILVAYKNDSPVGIIFEADRHVLPEFYRAIVKEERGKGLGSQLIHAFLNEAWKHDYPAVVAKTSLGNRVARKSYLYTAGNSECPLRIERLQSYIKVQFANPKIIESRLDASSRRFRLPHTSLADTLDEMTTHGFKPKFWVKTRFPDPQWFAVPHGIRPGSTRKQ